MKDNQFREPENKPPSNKEDFLVREDADTAENWEERHHEVDEEWSENFKLGLVAKFCQWLEKQHLHRTEDKIQTESEPSAPSGFMSTRIDLFTLLSELTALKQETKIANRQSKAMTEHWEKMHESAQQSIEALQREQNQRRTEVSSLKTAQIRPLLLGILEIRDRMEQGIAAAEKACSTSWLIRIAGGEKGIEELIEGQKMTMRNLDRLLASWGVSTLATEGGRFDPHIMRAVEVEKRPDLPNGQIIEEIRKGFLINDDILRPAEVKVNKQEEKE